MENILPDNVILGGGIAGISAAYHLKQKGEDSVVYEKDSDWGGLCGNFMIDGFRFDRFVHFTFAKDEYIAGIFAASAELYEHPSVSSNYYQGYWLKHPAQNNLFPLPPSEKVRIISDFVKRPQKEIKNINDYETWLRCQYGNYFAEHFPFAYTRKYWGMEPTKLETKWVGFRMHSPSLEEVLAGAFEEQKKNFYYTSVMKYPKYGGFRSILNKVKSEIELSLNKKAVLIDTEKQEVFFDDGSCIKYKHLVSTLPLPEIIKMLPNVPENVRKATENLRGTCGYQVSLGFNKPDIAKYLWFYIYDEDIPPARVYSPSLKSPDNAPQGCSSLQAEIFYANGTEIPPAEEVLEKTVSKLKEMGLFNDEDIVVKDIRFEPYANIIFDHNIYSCRKIVLDYLAEKNIKSIGRFGKWDYLWSHQAFESGII